MGIQRVVDSTLSRHVRPKESNGHPERAELNSLPSRKANVVPLRPKNMHTKTKMRCALHQYIQVSLITHKLKNASMREIIGNQNEARDG